MLVRKGDEQNMIQQRKEKGFQLIPHVAVVIIPFEIGNDRRVCRSTPPIIFFLFDRRK